ncbi:hypothetical protein C2W64_04064 [Brevibacillus laterosporus]|nr:hypothetical protein [Brevibacillus laterosporus]RAP29117.1 hypothetical protein C2W64_04064 [Brevibacillus laterosporus]
MKEMLDGLDEEELYHIINGMLDLSKISLRDGKIIDAKKARDYCKKGIGYQGNTSGRTS